MLDPDLARAPATRAAQFVSFVGQPPLVVTGVAAFLVFTTESSHALRMRTMGIVAGLVLIGFAFAAIQVWRGKWRDMDASDVREREVLSLFMTGLLALATGVSFWTGQATGLTIGLGVGAALAFIAFLLRRWLKTSLHAAVAALAAVLVWPYWPLAAALTISAVLVAWSRLQLRRHTRAEVGVGLMLGALMGLVYHALMRAAPLVFGPGAASL
jgi:hypothetical protein